VRLFFAAFFEGQAMSENTRVLKSTCHGCHGGCSVLLHVENDVLTKIEGDPDGPLNHGAVCPIGYAAKDLVYHPDRLKYPMKRIGPRGSGQWERISWDEALDTIASKVKQYQQEFGPESVVVGMGTGRHHAKWVIRFANVLGTPNWCEPGTAQCFLPRINVSLLTYGDFPVGDFSGKQAPECIIYWGHNPLNSGPDGETRFASRANLLASKQVIVVDPRANELTKRADVWLRLRPGTDDALALAMIHVIINEELYDKEFVSKWCHGFEQLRDHVQQYSPEWAEPITWVDADLIKQAARMYAKARPAQMEWGCAIEHTPNTIQTVRAVALLPALTGNIDVPGGWVFGGPGAGMPEFEREALDPEVAKKRLGNGQYKLLCEESIMPAAHIPAVLKAMRTGDPYPVKAFLVFGNNTLATYANAKEVYESLMKVDFLMYVDLFMQPTAELADIVLPAASWPELDGIHSAPFISAYVLGPIQKAVRIGECKSDEEILVELARRLKLERGTESVDEVTEAELASGTHGVKFEELKQRGAIILDIDYRKHEKNGGFRTPTGKVELYSTRLEEMGYAPLPYYEEPPESPYSTPEVAKDYPLVLTTGHRSPVFFHSEGRHIPRLRKAHKEPRCEIHPDTAAKYGIKDGEWMYIENLRGKIRQRAKFAPQIDPRIVAAEHGWWFPEDKSPEHGIWECNVNVLTNNQPPYDPAMGTYQLRGLLCKVSPVPESEAKAIA
jgi:thiosulfate reductase / polysulfide reductase chain A